MSLGVKPSLSEDEPNDALAQDEKCRSVAVSNWDKIRSMIKQENNT